MRRRTGIALLVAALLAAVAALLAALSERSRPARAEAQVEFPRSLRRSEQSRIQARRTLPVVRTSIGAPEITGEQEALQRRDPFLVAMPLDPGKPLLVLEANALRHSRLGELFVECVSRDRGDPLAEVRRESGIDPLKDIDRIAFAAGGVLVSGFFEHARLDRLEETSDVSRYGEDGRIFVPRAAGLGAERPEQQPSIGAWRNQLLIFGDPSFVRTAIDRLEGRAAAATSALPEQLTYGEAYGVVPGGALRALFRGEHSELGRRLAEVASRIELHVDAMRDVAVVARVSGPDPAALDDLGRAFGGALAVARVQARVRGEEQLAELLEHARVERGERGFSLELALPVEMLERWFEGCGQAAPELPGR